MQTENEMKNKEKLWRYINSWDIQPKKIYNYINRCFVNKKDIEDIIKRKSLELPKLDKWDELWIDSSSKEYVVWFIEWLNFLLTNH